MLSILIVEDNLNILENTAEMLGFSGYQIFTEQDGDEALKIAVVKRPDLILSDIEMPEMDGWEMLQRLRVDERTASIPVIFLTAYADDTYKTRAYTEGAVGYLVKPFTNNELLNTVQRYG
jgi:CheY-like chemotaxis protein